MKGKKLRELLALLAYHHGTPRTKRQLALALWPDSTAERARDCLYKALRDLKLLRQEIPLPVLDTRDGVYLELSEEQSDILLFQKWSRSDDPEEWKQAVGLYRGGFLDTEGYEWAVVAHSHYEIQFLDLVRALAQHYLSLGWEAEANHFQRMADSL